MLGGNPGETQTLQATDSHRHETVRSCVSFWLENFPFLRLFLSSYAYKWLGKLECCMLICFEELETEHLNSFHKIWVVDWRKDSAVKFMYCSCKGTPIGQFPSICVCSSQAPVTPVPGRSKAFCFQGYQPSFAHICTHTFTHKIKNVKNRGWKKWLSGRERLLLFQIPSMHFM